jgi:hypothetical protein
MTELFDYLGVEVKEGEEPKFEDIKRQIESKFVAVDRIEDRKDLIEPIINKAYGSYAKKAEAKFISLLKNNGLDATHSDFQDYSNVEELFEKGIGKLKDQLSKSSGDGKGDEKLKQQIIDLQAEKDRFKQSYEQKESEFNEFKANVETEKKNFKVNSTIQDAINKLKWDKNVNEFTKKGFVAELKSQYKFDLDDDKTIVRDKEGNRVYDPNKAASDPLDVQQVFELEAKKAKLWQQSEHDGKPAPEKTATRERREEAPEKPKRRAHPAFMGQ